MCFGFAITVALLNIDGLVEFGIQNERAVFVVQNETSWIEAQKENN